MSSSHSTSLIVRMLAFLLLLSAFGVGVIPGTAMAQQYSPFELEGRWRFFGLLAGDDGVNTGGWAYGSLTFDASATLTAGGFFIPSGEMRTVTSSNLTFGPDGRLTGTVTIAPGSHTVTVLAQYSRNDGVVSGVLTDQAGVRTDYGAFHLVRELSAPGASFQHVLATAPWRVHALTTPAVSGDPGVASVGTLQFDTAGHVTGTVVVGSDSRPVSGTVFVDSDSRISGTVMVGPESVTLNGALSHSVSFIAGVSTSELGTGPSAVLGYQLFSMTRMHVDPANPPQASHLTGSWRFYHLGVAAVPGNLGGWTTGRLTFDSSGNVTSGIVEFPDGDVDPISSGGVSVQANGVVTGTISTPLETTIVDATLTRSRDVVVGSTSSPIGEGFGHVVLIRELVPVLTSTPALIGPRGPVTVTFANGPGGSSEWVGLFPLSG